MTAQRQAQSLLSVPMSISATTGEQLDKAGIKDLSQLQFTTPGYVPAYSSGYTMVFLRGIGNNSFLTDPSVATFVDDVPRVYASMQENLVDVERVEVLKGAQGGLYGRDATGGVINIITRQPSTDSFHGVAKVAYGEKNTLQAAAYVNMPINDKVAWSVSIERDQHDPYITNNAVRNPYTAAMFPTGAPAFGLTGAQLAGALNAKVQPDKIADQNLWALDSKVLVKLTDDLKITFAGDYARKRDANGNQIFAGVPSYIDQVLLPGTFAGFGITAVIPPGFTKPNENFVVGRGWPVYTWLTDYGGSATAVWSLPHVDLTSITAYRAQQTDFEEDLSAAAVPIVVGSVHNRKWYLYQELRAVSTGTGPFHYLAGATYLSNNFHAENHTFILGLARLPANRAVLPTRNWSVYAQVGYDITPQLNLTVSGRYVHETNEADFIAPVVDSTSLKQTKFLPSATLSYKLDGGGNVYARYAKGFKSGGVNAIAPPSVFRDPVTGALGPGSVYSPEIVDTYEVGYRAPLFNRTVQVTTALFYNDYTNLQVAAHANAQHPEISLAMVNAGSARTYGAEGSVVWRVTRAVTLGANVGYLDAKYKTFKISGSPVLLPFDVSKQTMPNSPKWQLSFSGDLDQPINDHYRLVGNVLVSHLSSFLYLQSAFPGFLPEPSQDGYWLANARIGVRTTDDKYGLAIFANNLTNTAYTTFGSSSALGNQLTWGNPRIVGAEVSAKF